jgi:hypothetical protein
VTSDDLRKQGAGSWELRRGRRPEIGEGTWGTVVRCFRRLVFRIVINALGLFLEDLPGAVSGTVVDDDDFVWDVAKIQFEVQVLDGRRDAPLLIACGDDY